VAAGVKFGFSVKGGKSWFWGIRVRLGRMGTIGAADTIYDIILLRRVEIDGW